ncbi:MAG TPA: histidine kinase [Actinomycetota bacterium]|nr:histidine kinase [Actinomycetota bacterium]
MKRDPVARSVITFALLGLVALAAVAVAGTLVIRRIATNQAIDEARQVTKLAASVVERRVDDGLIPGRADSTGKVSSVVFTAVLRPPIVRVKILTKDGTVVYSDLSKLIGKRYPLDDQQRAAFRSGEVQAGFADLDAPRNRTERSLGSLLEVSAPISTPNGTPLLFETYQTASSVADNRRQLLRSFAPVLIVALIAFAALVIPLAWVVNRRMHRAARDREALLQRAVNASDLERQRIASDLHDGPIQEMAGLAMRLSALSELVDDPASKSALDDSAGAVRGSVATLRSAIVGVYPPNLQQAGLGPALNDLTARLPSEGLSVTLDVADPAGYSAAVDELLYRACQEGLRNVQAHANAHTVAVRVRRDGDDAVLEVTDDGRGVDPTTTGVGRTDGHMGLQILHDLIQNAGGTLTLSPADGGGSVLRVEVPAG